jgi:hypothetical protein
MIYVYPHAIDRFIERVAPVSREEARDCILSSAKAIEAAAGFGCSVVRLGSRARLILDGQNVVTVYGAEMRPRQCRNPFRGQA